MQNKYTPRVDMILEEKRATKAAYERERRKKNPELFADSQRRYYKKHPGIAAERSRKWRSSHPETPEQRQARLDYIKQYIQDRPEQRKRTERKSHLKCKFGITEEQYRELYISQEGKCAICHKSDGDGHFLSIDHDHETGKIRGLLCKRCNTALGSLGDSIENLQSAIKYLQIMRPEYFQVGDPVTESNAQVMKRINP